MAAPPLEYSETRDLYGEILKKAQMQADQELVNLIRSRIRDLVAPPAHTAPGCRIIPFPCAAGQPAAALPEICFWKNADFWQDLIQFLVGLSLSLSFVLTFFVLTARW